MSTATFRFGVSRLPPTIPELRQRVEDCEAAGFDFVAIGDHVVGGVSPLATLAAAATASDKLRLRTYVINTAIWNPEFLAREALTLEQLSGGRLELGLGAGNAKSESETGGAAWQGADARVAQMRETLLTVRRRLEAADPNPAPACVLVGAMSRAGLDVAAEHADIVAFSGLRHKTGHPLGTLRGVTAEETDELVEAVRQKAGSRAYESDILLQTVQLGRDPHLAAKAWLEEDPDDMGPTAFAESPCALFAKTAADAAAEIERRRERWGFTSMTTFEGSAAALSAVMQEMR